MGIAKDLYRSVLRVLPEKPALYLIYFRGYQKILNLKNPQYFGEKIQWLKLYGHLDELSDYVDKYAVREFVAKTVGDKYLNQLYGVYNNPDEIDYEKLPKRFVLKCTNGSGAVLICKDSRAKKIITVSEFSKREIIKYYNAPEDKIVVIPNAWQHYERIGFDEKTLNKYGLEKEQYFFAMGSMEPNKNFKWIAEQARKMPNQIFAIAGSINEKVFSDGLGFECPNNMKLLGFVSDQEAKTLMRDCMAFLFPSIYEGFGIPPLESISAGARQVIVSDTEVMHEIFGNSVSYIDPNVYELDINSLKPIETDILSKYSWSMSSKIIFKVISNFLER